MERSYRSAVSGDPAVTRTALGLDQVPIPTMQSGRYYRVPNGTTTTNTPAAGTLIATAKFIPSATTIDRLGMEVSVIGDVGSKVRLGIYADDGTYRPGALVLDAGTINGDSATRQDLTISQSLPRGWYWFAAVNQVVTSVAPQWRALSNSAESLPLDALTAQPSSGGGVFGLTASSVTAALPALFGTPGRSAVGTYMWVRVA